MISSTQVADLREGDVITLANNTTTLTGPLASYGLKSSAGLCLGEGTAVVIRRSDGCLASYWTGRDWNLKVLTPAPPPLYRNHSRDYPTKGDVVRNGIDFPEKFGPNKLTWFYDGQVWRSIHNDGIPITGSMPRGVILLVDGDTGKVVDS